MRIRLGCLLFTALCSLSCSLPSLESRACANARDSAKQFYSFHFANDMHPSPEYRELHRRFVTEEMSRWLEEPGFQKLDVFTGVENDDPSGYPKTFKIGQCSPGDSAPEDDVFLQVQLYWLEEKDSQRQTRQRDHNVEMVRIGDQWFVATTNKGFNRK